MGYFVGLELSDSNRASAKAAPEIIANDFPEVTWLNEEQLYCVLAYCPIDASAVELLTRAINEIGENVAPFAFTIDKAGCFPPDGPARVAWFGIKETDEQRGMLGRLIDQLSQTLSRFCEIKERPMPHIPLGRASDRAPKKDLRKYAARIHLESETQEVTRIVVVESTKGHKGLNYRIIASAELSAQLWG